MLLKDHLYLLYRESEHYYSQAFSANETVDQTCQMMEHQYAEVTACKTEYDVIECKSLSDSIKSSEYEDMAAYRNSAHTCCTDYECPSYDIMTTPMAQKETTVTDDIMSVDETYI